MAKISTDGRITVPKAVRDALGLRSGDRVLFRVDSQRAVIVRAPDFLQLAGAVPVPTAKRGARWSDIRALTRSARARSHS